MGETHSKRVEKNLCQGLRGVPLLRLGKESTAQCNEPKSHDIYNRSHDSSKCAHVYKYCHVTIHGRSWLATRRAASSQGPRRGREALE